MGTHVSHLHTSLLTSSERGLTPPAPPVRAPFLPCFAFVAGGVRVRSTEGAPSRAERPRARRRLARFMANAIANVIFVGRDEMRR
jgi:hypothetical protein